MTVRMSPALRYLLEKLARREDLDLNALTVEAIQMLVNQRLTPQQQAQLLELAKQEQAILGIISGPDDETLGIGQALPKSQEQAAGVKSSRNSRPSTRKKKKADDLEEAA